MLGFGFEIERLFAQDLWPIRVGGSPEEVVDDRPKRRRVIRAKIEDDGKLQDSLQGSPAGELEGTN
jgi:hypothetical protein